MTTRASHSKATTQPSITNADRAEYAAYTPDQYGLHKEGRADYDRPEDMAADPDLRSAALHPGARRGRPLANAPNRTHELRSRGARALPRIPGKLAEAPTRPATANQISYPITLQTVQRSRSVSL